MAKQGQTFRAGVGAVIINRSGKVLALERSDVPDAWQMPQGGLEVGEEPLAAVRREIFEEAGIHQSEITLMVDSQPLLSYELPPEYRTAKTGRGQTQRWFLFRYEGLDKSIKPGTEFVRWRWMALADLVAQVAGFRKPVYGELLRLFGREIWRTT